MKEIHIGPYIGRCTHLAGNTTLGGYMCGTVLVVKEIVPGRWTVMERGWEKENPWFWERYATVDSRAKGDICSVGEPFNDWKLISEYVVWQLRQKNKETKMMNPIIVEVFEKTADAVLVDKHFGPEITNSFAIKILLREHKEEYLKEAQRREALLLEKK